MSWKKNKREIIQRLHPAIARARDILKDRRENRTEIAIEAAGNWYSQWTKRRKVPVNLLSLYQQTVGNRLMPKTPRFLLSTGEQANVPTVAAMQALLNKDVEKMNMADTFQRIVIDALYSVGIAKISLATPCDAAMTAWHQEAGKPMLARVDLDDFVFDGNARMIGDESFIGHRFRCPLDVARELYKKHADNLQAVSSAAYDVNQEGDYRIGILGRGNYGTLEFEEHVELWEIYLPRHRKVVVLADQNVMYSTGDGAEETLWEQDWVGPDSGPYHILGFGIVPGSWMPKAPMMDLMDLHQDANDAFRKANRMVRNLKELTTFRKGNDQDAQAIIAAKDGDIIGLDNPKEVTSLITRGSAMQAVLAMANAYKQLFSFIGGNLELLGGRAPQSRTAHQDEMLNENASAGIADMQERTSKFVSACGNAMGWFYHHDPSSIQKVSRPLDSDPSRSVIHEIHPWNSDKPGVRKRNFPFEDMDIRVDPYSMQTKSPQQKMAALNQLMMQVVQPFMPFIQQQGFYPDMQEILGMAADWNDMPEFRRALGMGNPPPTEGGASESHGKSLPASTSRSYTRRSQSGDTQGSEDSLQAAMLGHDLGGASGGKSAANGFLQPSTNGAG